jgi:formiminotetrahydrofolate cyclodeaminase
MSAKDQSLDAFLSDLASSLPSPGGGGAAALCGALAAGLASMVVALSIGKKQCAAHEAELSGLGIRAEAARQELLALIDADAEAFEPLAKAYGIPKDDPERDTVMEGALRVGSSVPADIVRTCGRALDVIAEFAEKGSRLAVSDAGCAAVLCKAAMKAAALNVFINTKSMKDREYAEALNAEMESLLGTYCLKADDIYAEVRESLR